MIIKDGFNVNVLNDITNLQYILPWFRETDNRSIPNCDAYALWLVF